MIHCGLLRDQGILIVTPEGPLQQADFEALAQLVGPFIEAEGELHGLPVYAEAFHCAFPLELNDAIP
jgi:hypothetical protein